MLPSAKHFSMKRRPETLIEKELARAVEPLNIEFAKIRLEFSQHPPRCIETLEDELRRDIDDLVKVQDWHVSEKCTNDSRADLRVMKYAPASISAMREALEAKRRALVDLLLAPLADRDLEAKVEALRRQPLPELRKVGSLAKM
jgi:hypothetical protein